MAQSIEQIIDGEVIGGAGGSGPGKPVAATPTPSLTTPRKSKKAPEQHSVFSNRRGLLLTVEQLSGPPAPHYLLRKPNVYGSQNLL